LLKADDQTKLVALGITDEVETEELEAIASAPTALNVIYVPEWLNLNEVENRLKQLSCTGKWRSCQNGIDSLIDTEY